MGNGIISKNLRPFCSAVFIKKKKKRKKKGHKIFYFLFVYFCSFNHKKYLFGKRIEKIQYKYCFLLSSIVCYSNQINRLTTFSFIIILNGCNVFTVTNIFLCLRT